MQVPPWGEFAQEMAAATEVSALESSVQEDLALPEVYRARLIDLKSMNWALRLAVGVCLVQLLIVAITIGLRQVPQPGVSIKLTGYDAVWMPVSVVIASAISITLAWAAALVGAFHSPWYFRFPLLALFTACTLSTQGFLVRPTEGDLFADLTTLGAFAILLIPWGWSILLPILERLLSNQEDTKKTSAFVLLSTVTIIVVSLVIVTNYVIPFISAVTSNQLEELGKGIGAQTGFLFLLLTPALLLAGTDWAEWGEAVASSLASASPRPRRGYLLAALVVTLSSAAFSMIDIHAQHSEAGMGLLAALFLFGGLLLALLGICGLWLVSRLGRLEGWLQAPIPFWVTIATLLATLILIYLAPFALLLFPIAGGYLVFQGRKRRWRQASTGIFLLLYLPVGIVAFGLYLYGGAWLQLMVAGASFFVLCLVFLRPRNDTYQRTLILQLIWLNLSLVVVTVIADLLKGIGALAAQITVIQAILLIFALVWDFSMSGAQVTNVAGRALSRSARILLYLSYVTLVSVFVIYFAPFVKIAVSSGFGSFFDTDSWALFGLAALGIPLIFSRFVLSTGQIWSSAQTFRSAVVTTANSKHQAERAAKKGTFWSDTIKWGLIVGAVSVVPLATGVVAVITGSDWLGGADGLLGLFPGMSSLVVALAFVSYLIVAHNESRRSGKLNRAIGASVMVSILISAIYAISSVFASIPPIHPLLLSIPIQDGSDGPVIALLARVLVILILTVILTVLSALAAVILGLLGGLSVLRKR